MKSRNLDKYQTCRKSRDEGHYGKRYRGSERYCLTGPSQGALPQAKQAELEMGHHEHKAEAAPNNLLDEERRKTVAGV
jgi:hypothetical protein